MKRARFMPHGLLAITADSWGLEFDCVAQPAQPFDVAGEFAVVAITGPLLQHASWLWDGYDAIEARVGAALASPATTVVLRISSPGGHVAGCFELAETLRARAKSAGKRLLAYVDGQAQSAAYALACAAERIVLPPSGLVGSIGTMQVAVDATAANRAAGLEFAIFTSGSRKADGNPMTPMTEEARAAIQATVDELAAAFYALVGRARALSPASVGSLEAGTFVGAKAVEAGLADAVMTFAELVASGGQINAQSGAEENMDEEEKARAALTAIAEGDDDKAAARAKKALAALAEGEEEDKPKDDDKGDSESKAKAEGGDEDAKPKDDDKDKPEAKATASVSGDPALALAAKVQSLEAWKTAREEREERETLMASRPDFAPEVVALMNRSPLAVVRDAVKNLPRGASKASGQVAAARAAMHAQPTVGDGQGDLKSALPEQEAHDLDVQMGLSRRTNAIRHEGTKLILGVMTPAEARAELAKKGATK